MIKPKDIHPFEIEAAKTFIREPLSEGFKAWRTLRDRDNVTMTIHELAHLMAWYVEVVAEARAQKMVEALRPPVPLNLAPVESPALGTGEIHE